MRILRLLAVVLFAGSLTFPAGAVTGDRLAADPVQPEWGDESAPIRPGSSLGGYCTFDWVFYEEVTPTEEEPEPIPAIYIGTAGHCTDTLGERVTLAGFGEIGSVVYDSDLVNSDVDFSLVEIDPQLVGKTNPKMRGWDGPHGAITADMLALGDQVDVYGYGIGVGLREETRPRFGFLVGWDEDEYIADMPAVNGDSGAPLLHHDTGFALGIISRYGFFVVPPSTDTGPMMPWIFRELEAAGFDDVILATVQA